MGKIQGDCGKQTEQELALFLRGLKYWAYIVPKKVGGQPFDVIACKKNKVWLLDAKHLEATEASFPLDRIEPNQWTSMEFAHELANIENMGFAIFWERKHDFYFLHYNDAVCLRKNGIKSVKIDELPFLLYEEVER